jgi:hypothetical protein
MLSGHGSEKVGASLLSFSLGIFSLPKPVVEPNIHLGFVKSRAGLQKHSGWGNASSRVPYKLRLLIQSIVSNAQYPEFSIYQLSVSLP